MSDFEKAREINKSLNRFPDLGSALSKISWELERIATALEELLSRLKGS